MKKKIMLFAQLVTEIDISKYKQKEYVKIVKAIYWEIFGSKKNHKITISPQSTKKTNCRTNPTSNPNNSIV